ncbi:MAG: hypothetical protein R2932_29450 [Caldilineaceae bacterium]
MTIQCSGSCNADDCDAIEEAKGHNQHPSVRAKERSYQEQNQQPWQRQRASTSRNTISSMSPPTYPNVIPTNPPHVTANAVPATVTNSPIRPPSNVREKTSRPNLSVPVRDAAEGAAANGCCIKGNWVIGYDHGRRQGNTEMETHQQQSE